MSIYLVHSKPGDAPSKGKIERFWRTLRSQLMGRLDLERVTSIDELFERAKAAGARVLAEPANHMYGERQCSFVDPWGRPWTLSETIFDSDPSDWGGELLVE